MLDRRKFVVVGVGLTAIELLIPQRLIAQQAPGDGDRDPDGGLLSSPGQTLPGPGGPYWTTSFQTNKQKLVEDIQTTVDAAVTLSAQLTKFGAATSSNVLLGFGGGYAFAAVVWSIIGAILDAVDPPRPNYKSGTFCHAVPFSDLSRIVKTVNGVGAGRQTKPVIEQSYIALVDAANFLASLEFYQGAAAKDDLKWMTTHRKNYVKYWNSMKSSLTDACVTMEAVPAVINSALGEAEVSSQQIDKHYQQNKAAVHSQVREDHVTLATALHGLCSDFAIVDNTPPKLRLERSFQRSLQELTASARRANQRTRQLPRFE